MKVLVAGASGFIGSHVAVYLAAQGHEVVAAARNPAAAAKRLPDLDWIAYDFRRDGPEIWRERLAGVEAVVNCVGVLQDGLGDDSRAAHVDGAGALFDACEAAGVRRIVHISAVGAAEASGSTYGRDKEAGEVRLCASGVEWLILRPSLVVAQSVYGGTALIRALCGLPWVTPVVAPEARFRPIAMEDVCQAVATALFAETEAGQSWDLAGPETVTQAELLSAYRRWLGFGHTRIWAVPRWLARPVVWCGDLLGWMGVRTAMRSNAIQQLEYDVAGNPESWLAATGAEPVGFSDYLKQRPATLQDRWHARLGFARPAARLMLGLFWLLSGLIALTVGARGAIGLMIEAGLPVLTSHVLLGLTATFDIVIGLAMMLKWRVRMMSVLMIAGTLGYLVALSFLIPSLWADPLGPLVKTLPAMALAWVIAATEDER